MLPCNVIVQEISDGQVEVTAIDPLASMQAVENPAVKEIAFEISNKLKPVIERVSRYSFPTRAQGRGLIMSRHSEIKNEQYPFCLLDLIGPKSLPISLGGGDEDENKACNFCDTCGFLSKFVPSGSHFL